MDKTSQVKVAMMLDDGGKVEYANEGGCWASCHHDLRSMPDVDPNASKHPKAKALDIRSNGPTKYLEGKPHRPVHQGQTARRLEQAQVRRGHRRSAQGG